MSKITEIESPLQGTKAYAMGHCSIMVSREEHNERGVIVPRWHMSISRSDHYPSWGEICRARYELLPNEVTMAMMLPPKEQYVNIHPNCFHLYEIDSE